MQKIKELFGKQRANRWSVSQTTADGRITKLRKLRKAILDGRERLHRAIFDDFRKNPGETDLTELLPTIAELNHTIRHLRHWMRPVGAPTPLALFGTKSLLTYEAKGLVLVLAPWNYPFHLSVTPVIAAIAAGNCVILKPSSKTPHTSRFLSDLFADVFDEREVAVVDGDHSVSDQLLEMPFDHFFFTGSPRIGKKVMAAASKHLATVTLELGGKSPVVVDETANVRKAAERILWGKFINAGQTCVAPDYLLIHESLHDKFITEARKVLDWRFGKTEHDRGNTDSFCRLVSESHCAGLKKLLEDSVESGARIETGGTVELQERFLSPTLLSGVKNNSPIMKEEIFGPILPIMKFNTLDEAIRIIQERDKPLALYVFSRNNRNINKVLRSTTAGGSCVNSLIIHLANPNIPFGGVGLSGMGNYHGFHGFRQLSHERSVLRQGRLDALQFVYPPYTITVKKLIELVTKFLA